jgi:hypothetical protein
MIRWLEGGSISTRIATFHSRARAVVLSLKLASPMINSPASASDFHLFSVVKKQLEQTQKSDPDTLFGQLDEISDAIPAEKLERVFQAWVDWVQ